MQTKRECIEQKHAKKLKKKNKRKKKKNMKLLNEFYMKNHSSKFMPNNNELPRKSKLWHRNRKRLNECQVHDIYNTMPWIT